MTRKDSKTNESYCDKRKVAKIEKEFQRKILSRQERILRQTKAIATREKLLRQRKSFKERSYRDTILYVATQKEYNSCRNRKNDVAIRND